MKKRTTVAATLVILAIVLVGALGAPRVVDLLREHENSVQEIIALIDKGDDEGAVALLDSPYATIIDATVGPSVSLENTGIAPEDAIQAVAVNTTLAGQLVAQTSDTGTTMVASARTNPQEIDAQALVDAGRALKSFRFNYYLGWGLHAGGMILVWVGTLTESPALMLIGAIVALGGRVWQLISFNSIGVAGERLIRAGEER